MISIIHFYCWNNKVDPNVVVQLSKMLDENNVHAKSFRMASERLKDGVVQNLKLKLIAERNSDGRINNLSTVSEVAALVVGDIESTCQRDIIMETQSGQLKRIDELHASYLAFQYPLLFPYGEDGYRHDVCHRVRVDSHNRKRNHVTSTKNEAQTLFRSRRLFHQFLVDGYIMVESERLSFIKRNQKKLRVDKYRNLSESQPMEQSQAFNIGKRVILPSTFVGSRRYMDQLYFDGMSICGSVRFPDLFLTMTCNPNWPEITRLLKPMGLKPHDRPDIISRVFKMKFEELLQDLKKRHILGKILACKSLKDYPPMPYPNGYIYQSLTDVFILYFAEEQSKIFHTIIQAVNHQHGRMFFLYGYGGTSKTHMWKTLTYAMRAQKQIVLTVASSDIASLLLPGGRTAHSKYLFQVLRTLLATFIKVLNLLIY
ncbi:hypothetical protein Lal_00015234 [Lupinus albus]|nr:hypothetical protein Lal_00015234 [Lupinus albus]